MNNPAKPILFALLMLSGVCSRDVTAELAQKKELTFEAYDRWQRIDHAVLSADGRWAVYTLNTPLEQAHLVVRSLGGKVEWRVSRGEVARHRRLFAVPPGREPAQITADLRQVLFTIAGGANAPDKSAATALGIMSLADGQVRRIPRVASYAIPEKAGGYVAYVPAREMAEQVLVLRNLASGQEERMADVSAFAFDVPGRYLAYSVNTADATRNGVFVRRLSDGHVTALLRGPGDHRQPVFDAAGQQIAFLSSPDPAGAGRYSLYLAASPTSSAREVVKAAELRSEMQIAAGENGIPPAGSNTLAFTPASNAVTFRLALKTNSAKRTADEPDLELWHWKDEVLQSEKWKRPPTYLAVYHISAGRWVQLESQDVPMVLLGRDARHAVGINPAPYRIAQDWGVNDMDVYLLDTQTGKPRLWRRKFSMARLLPSRVPSELFPFRISPGGRYLLYFEHRRWYSHDLEHDRTVDLTGSLLSQKVQFDLELSHSHIPVYPAPMRTAWLGIAGWTADDRCVLIYDRRDIWEIDPTGAAPARNLTAGMGVEKDVTFRLWPHDMTPNFGSTAAPQDEPINTATPLLLTAFDWRSMAQGLWMLRAGRAPEPLLAPQKKVTLLAKSERGAGYLLTQESFEEFPDLWGGTRLDRLARLSDANPQQTEYRWGTADLIEWKGFNNVTARGVLYKPEGFDPSKRYPMIVEVYGLSDLQLNDYWMPDPTGTAFIKTPATYLSREYIVFMPNTYASVRSPGDSVLASVVPGVQAVIDHGFVDPARIGLAGHSWGGYEVNYMITRTNMFRCAIVGAGASNLLSHYGNVHVAALGPFRVERGEYVMGASPYEELLPYVMNSPALFAHRVQTPLLIMHNEKDTAVSFAQGIEMHFALRRNGKEAYLLNYRNEGHTMDEHANRRDWEQRMLQYWDHFLKDMPKPDWMAHGIPYQLPRNTSVADAH